MKKRITNSNKPIGEMTRISDFSATTREVGYTGRDCKSYAFFEEVECGFFQAQCEAISHEIPEDDP